MPDFGRRLDGVGGRRHAPREPILLAATVTTLAATNLAVVINLSETGARLRGAKLPRKGEALIVKVAGLHAFARTVWCRGELCGVQFEEAISSSHVKRLRAEGRVRIASKRTPEEQLAFEDWSLGVAR